ncbi:MAG: flagellar FliJ family protein [Ignavibacteriales bacterium]|nr:flagellar FliJ family protein [Ignavibacteriota bacterium]MCB9248063.1 flagellar FliJ family protein [Ignavibacteriales bacterium]
MTKFKYKFEAIKNIKERFEKIVQKEIAIINLDIDNLKTEIERLNNERKGTRLKKLTNSSVKISDLQFYSKHENYLESQMKILRKMVEKKNIEKAKKLEELIKRSKETKTFEKLKEKHKDEHTKTQEKIEQLEMDEIAVKEFNR